MKRLVAVMTIFSIAAIWIACGTKAHVKMLKPAELDVGSVRKIAVMDFDFTGSWDYEDEEEAPKNIRELGERILLEAFNTEKPLDPKTAYPGKTISERFVAKLVTNGYYTVIERERLSQVLEEQALNLSGVIDPGQAVEIGKLVGAEGLIMGSGTYSLSNKGSWETYKEKKVEKQRYRINSEAQATVTYNIVNVNTGVIIASRTNSARNSRSVTGDNEQAARSSLPDWRPMIDGCVDQILNQAIVQIAPHYITESREIEEGDSEIMESAVEYAKRNMWQEAGQLWQSVMDNPTADFDDKVAATYNMGLYYEITGQLDLAESHYDRSFQMSGDTKYLDAKARIRARRDELKRLEQQQKS